MKKIFRRMGVGIVGAVFAFTTLLAPVAAQDVSVPERTYVALGDSVAAGAGLPTDTNKTSGVDQLCGRSTNAYPHLVAAEAGMMLQHTACSGAKVNDLYNSQDVNGANLAPQLEAAFANGTPDVISMTIGANDVQWVHFLRQCYLVACGGDASSLAAKVARGYMRVELFWALSRIEQLSNGNPPQVYLTGYFVPYSDAVCADTQGIDPIEKDWLNTQSHYLSRAVESVTEWFSFAHYVPMDFTGHEVCSADPWIQNLQEPTPYHPTVGGHQAIAEAVRRALAASTEEAL